MLSKIKKKTKQVFMKITGWLLGDLLPKKFDHVLLKKSLVDDLCEIAEKAYPKESIVLLSGEINDSTLLIDEITIKPYYAGNYETLIKMDLPILNSVVGSIHSHPGFSNKPSRADRHFFNKHGLVHGIISRPYTEETIAFYNKKGREIDYEVVD